MNLTITARHFKLPDDLRAYIEEKVKKLNRYYDGIIDLEVVLSWEKLQRNAELVIRVNNKPIVIVEKSDDLRKSFDLALDRAERQLKKHKEKMRTVEANKIRTA